MPAGSTLLIVESPAKAKTIAKFLGSRYKVEASQGHVRDLPKSQIGIDPTHDFDLKYITIRGRGKILMKIRKEAKAASRILLATDPDREGEAISWHLAQTLGIDPATPCRVEFHEITKSAIKNAVAHPRPIDMSRVDAQQARRALDRLVGYKISPLLWAKVRKGLSAGRVQSVATRMVVDREAEIEAFIPEEYWEIVASTPLSHHRGRKAAYQVRLATVDGERAHITCEADAKAAASRMEAASFAVYGVKNGEKTRLPQPPFTTSSLQQEAGRKLGFTTAKTMQVVQQLYEGVDIAGEGTVGLVSYIRTDSVRVSEEALAAVRAYIGTRFDTPYLPEKPNEFKGRKNAQDAHEAIRPTDVAREPDTVKPSLTREQYLLYKLIHTRFLASQMTPALYDTLTLDIRGGGLGLRYYGEHRRFAGCMAVYVAADDDEEKIADSALPQVAEGDAVSISEITTTQRFTQPPARYTEASLVRALEEKGIGRPSTYAPTITTIIARGYVTREKKRLYPTELGRMVTGMMTEYFADIVDTEFTASMEEQLDEVEEGKMEWRSILRTFYPPFEKTLEHAENEIEKVEMHDEVSDIPCDKCGAMMVYKMGRFGRFLACPNFPECRSTKPILIYVKAKCPKCGARLMEKTSRHNRKFYGCERYPECDFVSWDEPAEKSCPECGGFMTVKRGKKGETWLLCANEACHHREKLETPEEDDAE